MARPMEVEVGGMTPGAESEGVLDPFAKYDKRTSPRYNARTMRWWLACSHHAYSLRYSEAPVVFLRGAARHAPIAYL